LLSWGETKQEGGRSVRLMRTRCNYGGARRWLQCPAGSCRRRVGVLYLRNDLIACRQCLRLAYRSQREEFGVRRLRRARAVRLKLGFSADVDSLLGPKPHTLGLQGSLFTRFLVSCSQRFYRLRGSSARSVICTLRASLYS
jgi:hypothetical protein